MKRNRRRAFALLWAAPAWIRSIAVGARTLLSAQETAVGEAGHASDRNDRLGQAAPFLIPTFSRNAAGDHACTGCQRCAEVCPSRCLEIEGISESAGGSGVAHFQLDLGRCIGCGDCVAVCPESALESTPLLASLSAPLSMTLSTTSSGESRSEVYALASGDAGLRRDLLAVEVTS